MSAGGVSDARNIDGTSKHIPFASVVNVRGRVNMKNVLKTLASQKEEVQKEFEQLQKTQTQLQQQLNQVSTRIVQLQGKFQQLEQLEKDFQEE